MIMTCADRSKAESDAGSTFSLGEVAAGDVVFVYSQAKQLKEKFRRLLNVSGQRLLMATRSVERISLFENLPKYSHVMIGVGGGLVIHADGKSVNIDIVTDTIGISMTDAAKFEIFRRRDLSVEKAQAIVNAAYRYYGQAYGFIPFFGRHRKAAEEDKDTTQFCSRLVAYAFRTTGLALTSLADAKVLPLDLYRICQNEHDWQNISDRFVEKRITEVAWRALEEAGLAKQLGFSEEELILLLKGDKKRDFEFANWYKEKLRIKHKSVRDRLDLEMKGIQLVLLHFELARSRFCDPETLDENDAGDITKILEQLPALLDYANLSSLELCVPVVLNPNFSDEVVNTPDFVGLPTPFIMYEMRLQKESLRILTCLLFGAIGIFVIAACQLNDVRFAQFRAVKAEFSIKFLAAIPRVANLDSLLQAARDGFIWITDSSEREFISSLFCSIVGVLQQLENLREQSGSA